MLEYQERRVLIALAKGSTLSKIAKDEGVTIFYLKSNILGPLYRKLGARSATTAVAQGFVKGCLLREDVPETQPRVSLNILTKKEILVFNEWREGDVSKVLGERLGMSACAVRGHMQRARNKTGLTNEELARALAIRRLGRVS